MNFSLKSQTLLSSKNTSLNWSKQGLEPKVPGNITKDYILKLGSETQEGLTQTDKDGNPIEPKEWTEPLSEHEGERKCIVLSKKKKNN